ncbi:hypothetical protein PSRA_1456 [Pseudoscardovia radai]|uniref:DUF3566 domain-containing protein n=1 Tax=Pseudoscardovia radai TaxID=987066 RepID=A0A261EUL0_9BIFI|nr:DUF3566 domain-containing protein [Pseudoscardovia radai]OZG50539.1 hypothetical protein PSRA_1456 [Pseudoscardovia radai]
MTDENIAPNANQNPGAGYQASGTRRSYYTAPGMDDYQAASASSSVEPLIPEAAPAAPAAHAARTAASAPRRTAASHIAAPAASASAPSGRTAVSGGSQHPQQHRSASSGASSPSSSSASEGHRHHKTPRARRMKLSLTRIDPWSATKVGFMLSFAISLIIGVALFVAWLVFASSNAMNSINSLVSSSGLDSVTSSLSAIFTTGHVVSVLVILAVFNIVLFTLLAAINAFLYNVTARLVGGLRVTLGDD